MHGSQIKDKLTLQPYPHEPVWIKGNVGYKAGSPTVSIWRQKATGPIPTVVVNTVIPDGRLQGRSASSSTLPQQVATKRIGGAQVRHFTSTRRQAATFGDNPVGKTVKPAVIDARHQWTHASSTPINGLGFTRRHGAITVSTFM